MNLRPFHFCLPLLFCTLATLCSKAQPAVDGQADLTAHDFSKGGVDLTGTWEFHWNKLLTPEDFDTVRIPGWIHVPGSWHRQGSYDRLGYATYRLRLKFSGAQTGLMVYFPIINSASRIWLNGELVAVSGDVGPDRAAYKPKLLGTVFTIPDKIREADLIVQSTNYTYFSGGIGSVPELAKAPDIIWRLDRSNGIENFFAGSLIAMFMYQLILYFLYHRGKPHLWLALICLGVALRAMIVHGGSFLLPNVFPDVSWEVWKKFEFGSVYSVVALFPLYIYHLFRSSAPRNPVIFLVGVSSLLLLAVLFSPQYTYGSLLEVAHVSLLLAFLYAFYTIAKAWRGGNQDAKTIFFGVLASFPFILAEILKNSVLFPVNVQFMYLVEMGVLLFLIFQVYLLANHQAKSYKSLESMNQNLEQVVQQRTHELVTANTVRDKLMSVMSHDIKSPLIALQNTLKMFNKGKIGKDEFSQFALSIEDDLSNTNLLVDNILHWTTGQLHGVKIKVERFNVSEVIEQNLQLFETASAQKGIHFTHNVSDHLQVTSDRNILNLVLRNLLANAIKFSHVGGSIEIHVAHAERSLTLRIQDHGVGMSSETLQGVISQDTPLSAAGTDKEKGMGLGLAICRDYLIKAGGSLTVESMVGKGSVFTVELPA